MVISEEKQSMVDHFVFGHNQGVRLGHFNDGREGKTLCLKENEKRMVGGKILKIQKMKPILLKINVLYII